jgi:O-methyltransferase
MGERRAAAPFPSPVEQDIDRGIVGRRRRVGGEVRCSRISEEKMPVNPFSRIVDPLMADSSSLRSVNEKISSIDGKLESLADRLSALERHNREIATAADKSGENQTPAREIATDLHSGTFLGHTPERYNKNLAAYRGSGGNFDPIANSITYANGDMVRFYAFGMFFDLIQKDKLLCDIAELGVWKGDTGVLLAGFARKLGTTAFLLDTYEGFDQRDLRSDEEHLKSAFRDTSLEAVRKRIGEDNVRYVAGYFPETASQLPADNKYCLVHIDCDLYGPVLSALEYFYPRLVSGGFLIMHDYMSLSWDGPVKAIDQFFADKPEFIVPIPDYAGTVVVRKI